MAPNRSSAITQLYGKACSECSKSKCKCISTSSGTCERCSRLKKLCVPGNSARARNTQRTRIDQIEGKLDNLVSILGSGGVLNTPSSGFDNISPPVTSSSTPTSLGAATAATGLTSAASAAPDISAEGSLDYFRSHLLKYFPFHLPPDVNAQRLRQDRPFLWLCLVTAASHSTQTKLALGDKIKRELTHRIFLANDPTAINIDLLLGLLTFLAWGHNQLLNSNPAQLARYTQLATTLVFDLRLNKPPVEESNMLSISQNLLSSKGLTRSLEEKRAVLGCFVLSSIVSVYFGHIDAMQWTPYMDECICALSQSNESPYDEMFVHQVRLQRIVGEVESARETSKAPPDFYLKFLQQKVDEVKTSISSRLREDRKFQYSISNHSSHLLTFPSTGVLSASVFYTELSIFGLVLSRKSPPGFQRLEYLYTCLNTVKSALENFFTVPISDYPGISFPVFTQLVRYIIVLYKLSTLNDSVWDLNLVRSSIDVIQVIDQVINNIKLAMSEMGEECASGVLERSIGIFSRFKSWSLPNLPVHVAPEESGIIDLPDSEESYTQLDALFFEDWWLRDNLSFGLEANETP
ncbi:phosphoketolase 1 [Penicillium canariense]|uniref:Phosphoketolase 1 n=1 Tax=Penicillium canariense TaxID=189055 RepID=A0A9W9I461_9EURO|nr:phosphoketolase 1 [Penicillium canariense]KAJ5166801.1 phosphoketolase 1 [Penicillium canariense]